ncbi:hypothetical protein KI387_023600, partial [Taxus chinensis]
PHFCCMCASLLSRLQFISAVNSSRIDVKPSSSEYPVPTVWKFSYVTDKNACR